MNFTTCSILSLTAFSVVGSSITACGSAFTCEEDRSCSSPRNPDGAAGTAAGSCGGGGSGGGAGSAGSAGTSGGTAGTGDSAVGQGGTAGGASDAGDAGTADSGACAVGTEGCTCTAARGCNTGLLCRSNVCTKPVCGDSRTEGNEFCDDGQNLGAAVGDCAPDCSTVVVQKKIVLSSSPVQPDFGKDGPGPLAENVDSRVTVVTARA